MKHKKLAKPDGRGGKIRTCGLTVPNRAHYQAVLRPVNHLKTSVEFYKRKIDRSSQTPVKSSKKRINNAVARERWLILPFIASDSSPNVRS